MIGAGEAIAVPTGDEAMVTASVGATARSSN